MKFICGPFSCRISACFGLSFATPQEGHRDTVSRATANPRASVKTLTARSIRAFSTVAGRESSKVRSTDSGTNGINIRCCLLTQDHCQHVTLSAVGCCSIPAALMKPNIKLQKDDGEKARRNYLTAAGGRVLHAQKFRTP